MEPPLTRLNFKVLFFFEPQIFDIILNGFHLDFVLEHVANFVDGVPDVKYGNFLVEFQRIIFERGEIFGVVMPVLDELVGIVAFSHNRSHLP